MVTLRFHITHAHIDDVDTIMYHNTIIIMYHILELCVWVPFIKVTLHYLKPAQ